MILKLKVGELRKLYRASIHPAGLIDMTGLSPARTRRRNSNNEKLRGAGYLERLPNGEYRITTVGREEVSKYHKTGIPEDEQET